jgi:hypothetical protein
LTQTHGVTVIPVSAFYQSSDAPASNHQLIRFCFAKQEATLDLAIERLAKVWFNHDKTMKKFLSKTTFCTPCCLSVLSLLLFLYIKTNG